MKYVSIQEVSSNKDVQSFVENFRKLWYVCTDKEERISIFLGRSFWTNINVFSSQHCI